MRVTRLKLASLRSIVAAEFRFQPGFNLIVGVNGVGNGVLSPYSQVAVWWLHQRLARMQ